MRKKNESLVSVVIYQKKRNLRYLRNLEDFPQLKKFSINLQCKSIY